MDQPEARTELPRKPAKYTRGQLSPSRLLLACCRVHCLVLKPLLAIHTCSALLPTQTFFIFTISNRRYSTHSLIHLRENMETPPPEQPVRRTTRSALVEIPARMGALSVADHRHNVRLNRLYGGNVLTSLQVDVGSPHVPPSFLSPAPSPDELVIAQRGRRRVPLTWSPDLEAKTGGHSPGKERTPVKSPSSIVLRSTPRKRLLLLDHSTDMSPSPEKRRNTVGGSPVAKRVRLDRPIAPFSGPVSVALRAFSTDQLIDIIQGVIGRHPHLEEEIRENLSAPDIRAQLDRLQELKRNIFKSLPTSRLASKTDSPAYTRASTHLSSFKKAVVEQGRMLNGSHQWETVLEYVLSAWEIVAGTPVWDNPPHNNPRRQCFKFLASLCMTVLKTTQLSQDQTDLLHAKLKSFVQDSDEILPTLKYLEGMKKK